MQLALHAPHPALAQAARPVEARGAKAVAELRFAVVLERARAGETIPVFVSAYDEQGAPLDAAIALDCDAGELGSLSRVVEGRYQAPLTLPEVIPGGRSILLIARSGAASAESLVPVGPGHAAAMEVEGPGAVLADGSSRGRVVIALADAFGNPADEIPRASAGRGAVRSAQQFGPGRWLIEYVPERRLEDGEDVLAVEAGPLRREIPVRLTTRRVWAALAPWSGFAVGDGLALGAALSAWRRAGEGRLGLVLDVGFWRAGEATDVAAPGATLSLDGDQGYLPATLSLAYGRRFGRRTAAALSVGGGVARVSSTERLEGQPEVSEAGAAPVGVAAASLGLRAWRGEAYVEVRALRIGDPGLATLSGSTRPVLLLLGYRLDGR